MSSPKGKRFGILGIVVLAHLLALWLLGATLRPLRILGSVSSNDIMMVTLQNLPPAARAFSEPALQTPQDIEVSEPQIEIEQADTSAASQGRSGVPFRTLAPRPDPSHANLSPELPSAFAALSGTARVVLKIFVLADGSIGDTHVVQSSGVSALDEIAAVFIKTNWRFSPALADGRPIDAWTTVQIVFRQS